ncbi:MAG: helix-turn-helix transcriptional regulator [Hyphomicrobiales bacterium]|nr:helix-turn-helix transcriptional regulator [Hyphomicrobiales bacterium]
MKALSVKADIITTPKGERLAILPLAEYRRLTADSEAKHISETMARIRSGEEETLSLEEVEEMLAAKSKLAFWRKKRGMSQGDPARRARISQSYLAGLEAGNHAGKPALIKRLAHELALRMEDIVPD